MTITQQAPRTYEVRTYGCAMNVHDSERLTGLLEGAGYVPGESGNTDVVVFNTCAVRENADNKLYGNLGILNEKKMENPDILGCRWWMPSSEGSRNHHQEGPMG